MSDENNHDQLIFFKKNRFLSVTTDNIEDLELTNFEIPDPVVKDDTHHLQLRNIEIPDPVASSRLVNTYAREAMRMPKYPIGTRYRNILPKPFAMHYEEYTTNIKFLSKEQILKRMEIVNNFFFYPEQTIQAITQYDELYFYHESFIIIDNKIALITKDTFVPWLQIKVQAGFWYTFVNENFNTSPGISHYGFDIISLQTFLLQHEYKHYSQSVEEIFDFFSTRNWIRRKNIHTGREFYIQEKNPITYTNPVFFDLFFSKFKIINISNMQNKHSRTICAVWTIETQYGEQVSIYYTFWRHINSQIFKILPLPPQPKYEPFFLTDKFNSEYDKIVLCPSILELYNDSNIIGIQNLIKNEHTNHNFNKSFIYGGFENILFADLSSFKNKKIYFMLDRQIDYILLKNISEIARENKFEKCYIILLKKMEIYDIEDILKSPELLNLERPNTIDLLAQPDDQIMGADRKRTMLLDPIIESGTITWLFAQEKAGKTMIALYLAQIIGTGNKAIGSWTSSDPKKVIYIDGEMPGDKLHTHIEKIIRGLDGNPEVDKRAFSVMPLAETDFSYDDILDDNFQEEHLEQILQHDLIILDNYYTLYNSLNPVKLIKWMKKITKLGPAFLILDHTNSEGELQGSHVKRRAMDLGLHIELFEGNEFNINFIHDRYGREYQSQQLTLTKCFTSSEFTLQPKLIFDSEKNKDLSNEDLELITIYLLKQQKKTNKEVGEILNIASSSLTKKLHAMNFDSNLETYKQDNIKGIKKQKEILTICENKKDYFNAKLEQMIELISTRNS